MSKRLIGSTLCLFALLCSMSYAQSTFSSGSTGADGAFAPTQDQTITVPDSGVFNYTTVNIPGGVHITYLRNTKNTPLTILASGDVSITGTISVDGRPGSPSGFGGFSGPGGFNGGSAGVDAAAGSLGDGPGAGRGGPVISTTICGGGGGGSYESVGAQGGSLNTICGGGGVGGQPGPKYGSRSLVPLLGGSGGGGGCAFPQASGGGGGGGGGAILIASSGTINFITVPSAGFIPSISARGGDGAGIACGVGGGGGAGSGGAIRLIATIIKGSAQLLVTGGRAGSASGAGGLGFVRIEAFDLTGFSATNAVAISSGLPSSVTPPNLPTLQITSVAGVAAPANPVGSFQENPDIILPASQPNPVTVLIAGANVPSGTIVNVTATAADGTSSTTQATLTGTTASSSGSASTTLSAGVTVLTATTVIDMAAIGDLKPIFINGEKVDKIEVASSYGGGSEVTYITHSGRRIRAIR